jgi:hypothetical protein
MYKIIGNDGQAYGPVPAEKLREWIAQGRVESRTAVLPDGAAEWTFVGLLPEFARDFSEPPLRITAPNPAPPPAGRTNGFATAGFICGLISVVCCCGCPFNILGLIFSIIALVQINQQVEKQAGWGLALAGLMCSAVSLLTTLGFGVLQLLLTPTHATYQLGGM